MMVAATFALGGCSHKKAAKTDSTADQAPGATDATPDAATDAVPMPAPDNSQVPPPAPASPELANNANPASPPPPSPAAPPAPVDTNAAPPAPPATTAASDSGSYTVQQGDTLMRIAFENYGDLYKWKSIYEANKDKISNPNAIPAGTVLKLDKKDSSVAIDRNGEKYLIVTGDTLGKISNKVYGTPNKWKTLWENNKQLIHDPNKIYAGFFLYYLKDTAPTPVAASDAAPRDPASSATSDTSAAVAPNTTATGP